MSRETRKDVGNAVDDEEIAGFIDEVEAIVRWDASDCRFFAVERRDNEVDALDDFAWFHSSPRCSTSWARRDVRGGSIVCVRISTACSTGEPAR